MVFETDMMHTTTTYSQQIPPAFLQAYVKYFWALENAAEISASNTLGPLVDGCPGMVIQLSSEGNVFDQYGKQLPRTFVYGQTLTRTELYLTGKFNVMGVCFFPDTLRPVFGVNANELTDSCLDLSLLPSAREFGLIEKLAGTTFPEKLVEILSAYLYFLIRKNNLSVDPITHFALSQIITSHGNVSLKELQEVLKLSERSLERRFDQQVGISPKLFARVCQFQAAFQQLKSNQYHKLSDIAFDNGFADQSHFIRTFRQFAGYSPFQFKKQAIYSVSGLTEQGK